MKRHLLLLLTFVLLFAATPPTTGQAAIVGTGCSTINGKLIAMTRLKKSYKLTVGEKVVFIIANGSQQSLKLIKTARSLINKPVTVVYIGTNSRVVSIFPAKQKQDE